MCNLIVAVSRAKQKERLKSLFYIVINISYRFAWLLVLLPDRLIAF